MHVFVINLAGATDRLAYMSEQLDGQFERIEAVRGLAVPERFAPNFAGKTPLLPGEVGCYSSHLLAAETVLARGLPYAVILEDDVDLADGFREIVSAGLDKITGEWDVISLSGAKQRPHCRLLELGGGSSLVRYLHFPKTTAAYVISQSGCRKLLRQRNRTRPVDVDIRYGWEMELEGYGIYPPPATQNKEFGSSIPKSKKQRFYWRANPVGYLMGRIDSVRRMGVGNLIRAYIEEARPH
jgi:glycosyl transferase family 25